jgi:hypothetical protein
MEKVLLVEHGDRCDQSMLTVRPQYVPLLATKFDEESFKHLKEEDLVKLNVPEEDRKKILDLVARLREAKEIVLEEMAWEINVRAPPTPVSLCMRAACAS